MKINEKDYIDYLAHMLDESCNEKACNNESRHEIDEDDFELKPLGYRKPRSGSSSPGKPVSGKPNTKFSLDQLHAMSQEEAAKKNVDMDMWQAAQLPFPHEEKHGGFSGGCSIYGMGGSKKDGEYLDRYIVSGTFKDGQSFEQYIGPNRRVAAMYVKLHKISVPAKQWEQFSKDFDAKSDPESPSYDKTGHAGFKIFDTLQDYVSIVKLGDGFYIQGSNYVEDARMTDDGEVEIFNRIAKIGPFPDKVIARRYAFENDMRFGPKQPKEKDDVSRINYPIFIFDYEMAGVDCMDIIIAETKESAMKLFATQWKMFDNSKVYRQKISSESDLEKELLAVRIKNINVYEIKKPELQEYIDIQSQIGNPLTNPKLKSRQRNHNCTYILGPGMKDGRLPVSIEQHYTRANK